MNRRAMLGALTALVALPLIATAQESGGLEVTELVLSKGWADGRPVDPSTSFSRSDGRIYAMVRVSNPSRSATTIRVAWERVGGPASSGGIELEIPARPRHRTLARTGTRRAAGRYRCVVYDADDRELSAAEFEITE